MMPSTVSLAGPKLVLSIQTSASSGVTTSRSPALGFLASTFTGGVAFVSLAGPEQELSQAPQARKSTRFDLMRPNIAASRLFGSLEGGPAWAMHRYDCSIVELRGAQIWLALALCTGIGCGEDTSLDSLILDAIQPSEGLEGELVAVRIVGDGFHLRLHTDLDSKDVSAADIGAEIGDVPLSNLVLVGDGTIEAQIPASLARGSHDLLVTFPDGREATLAAAYTVIREMASGPFGMAQPVDELETGQFEDDPTLPADMLEIYFNRGLSVSAPGDIWKATRPDVASPFSAPEPVAELNSMAADGEPKITADGLGLVFASSRGGGQGSNDLYISARPNRDTAWSPPVPIAELNTAQGETLFVTDESQTYAMFSRFTFGPLELYETSRSSPNDPWSAATPIDELNTSEDDGAGHLSANGLTAYFYSGGLGGAGVDIYHSSRDSIDSAWGTPEPFDELNTAGRDEDPWVSPDGFTIFYVVDGNIHTASR